MKRNYRIFVLAVAAAVCLTAGEVRRVEGGESTRVKGSVEKSGADGSKTTVTNIEKVVVTPGKAKDPPKPIETKKDAKDVKATGTAGAKKDPKPGNLNRVFNGTANAPATKPKS